MVKPKQTYEEIRQKRMEENKKRMEELNLTKLSQSLLSKPSPVKKAKLRISRSPGALTPVRRSNRVADKPPVSYKEVPIEPVERTGRSYQRRDLLNRVYASDEVRIYAVHRADQMQSSLGADFPSFVKPMLQSHVTGGFWLAHLPLYDEMITLEDENGDKSETKYLAAKHGLSGGWRGFSIDHELVDGDALVFQLVSPTKFKVYIVRAYDSEDNEDQENTKDDECKDNTEKKEGKGKIEENGKVSDAPDLSGRYPKRTRAGKK
ncbi:B3 DOMAIN-CONTAINING PROTEIN [Salix viminalis]|uniref:B3 DOMAIN-CONTAINING PROTEIN n=1 Tax=Salix viminalis TaxID=40686 RepID=A0A9Q0NK10_SALVM|nr:B3 DOMAIN-CONTAINING PROTEIN [Salix viminalis]